MEIPYLVTVNGRLHYRRVVKPEHRTYFGKREVKKSLGLRTGQELQAIPKVDALNKWFEAQEKAAVLTARGEADPHQISVKAWEWALDEKFAGHDTSGLGGVFEPDDHEHTPYDQFIDEIEAEAIKRVGMKRELQLSDFSPLDQAKIATVKKGGKLQPDVTLDAAISAYTEYTGGSLKKAEAHAFDQFKDWLKVSGEFPQYEAEGFLYLKDFNKAGAAKFIQYLGSVRRQAQSTVQRRVNSIRAMWSYALDHFEVDAVRNPWARPKIAASGNGSRKKTRVLPFHRSHLDAIEKGLSDPSVDPELNLVMRLYRCTGCRPSEIGGLHSNDVHRDEEGVWLKIEFNDVRRVKNENSERRVPVVDDAAARDLLAMIERKGEGPVFQKGFHEPTNLSNRGMYFLHKKCGIPKSPRLVNYSWRHTLIEALRVSRAPDDTVKAIVGHSDGSVTENYGAGAVSLSRMREALEAAMGVLGEVDTYHYTPEELMQPEVKA
jgi:integrase